MVELCARYAHNNDMKKLNFYLPEPALAKLKALSEKEDVSVAELVRRAIEEYLKRRQP